MISMYTKQEIILSYYREGNSQREISRRLRISRKTVKKYLKDYALEKQQDSCISQVGTEPKYKTFSY